MSARVVFGLLLGISSITLPALAIDADADLGGASVRGSADLGSGGASASGSANVPGIGGAEASGSVGTDGASGSVGGSVNGVGGAEARGSVSGSGLSGEIDSSSSEQGTASGGGSMAPSGTAQDTGRPQTIILPLILRASSGKDGEATPGKPGGSLRREQQFTLRSGTLDGIVRACREAIAAAAVSHGAVSVGAASAGRLGRAGDALVAPIAVSIEYRQQGGIERRQARVNCLLTEQGSVVEVR
jgi:hypothetical protein